MGPSKLFACGGDPSDHASSEDDRGSDGRATRSTEVLRDATVEGDRACSRLRMGTRRYSHSPHRWGATAGVGFLQVVSGALVVTVQEATVSTTQSRPLVCPVPRPRPNTLPGRISVRPPRPASPERLRREHWENLLHFGTRRLDVWGERRDRVGGEGSTHPRHGPETSGSPRPSGPPNYAELKGQRKGREEETSFGCDPTIFIRGRGSSDDTRGQGRSGPVSEERVRDDGTRGRRHAPEQDSRLPRGGCEVLDGTWGPPSPESCLPWVPPPGVLHCSWPGGVEE